MIKEVSYFEVHCDKCGCSLELDGITAWCDEDEAQDAMNYAGWEQHESERVYCDACIEAGEIMLNETDSYED